MQTKFLDQLPITVTDNTIYNYLLNNVTPVINSYAMYMSDADITAIIKNLVTEYNNGTLVTDDDAKRVIDSSLSNTYEA
jgi:hypothetical protein